MKQHHEAVKTLAIAIGVRKAARQLGLSEDRVRQWSKRESWFKLPPQPPSKANVTVVTSPSSVLANELETNGRETKLSLSRYARRAAKDSESLSTREAALVHKVAQVAGIVHGWNEEKADGKFTLNVLNMGSLEITAGPQDSAG